jgi:hypothetical protein
MPKFMRESLAITVVSRTPSGTTRKSKVFGTVFTFYGTNRDDALEYLVQERAKDEPFYAEAWESAREVSAVNSHDAVGLGFYRIRTTRDEKEPITTDVRYGWR